MWELLINGGLTPLQTMFIIYYNDNKYLFLVVYMSLLCFISSFFFFFFQKAENNRLKKSQLSKILKYYFLFLLKIGLVRPVDQLGSANCNLNQGNVMEKISTGW